MRGILLYKFLCIMHNTEIPDMFIVHGKDEELIYLVLPLFSIL